MPFIPHTEAEVQDMLSVIGADSIEQLFDEIPDNLRTKGLDKVPETASEMDIGRLMHARAAQDGAPLNFIGAGAYEHHIPAAVWELTTRGEFYTAYTPYQAEASQGTLQVVYEYQSMITALTALDYSNASLYDGASALAEAVLMAVRANRKSKSRTFLVPRALHPYYREVTHNIVKNQGIKLIEVDFDKDGGHTPVEALAEWDGQDICAVVIPQPNFFGVLEDVDQLTDWAHSNGALAIAVVNPMSLALLTPPGEWGEKGADIAVGEGQPLGIPLSSGGPYYGFMCCKKPLVRQMPGRIVGRTVDLDGKPGFVLTLQAREQHIRRSKATSNICTNQGLAVTASTIYMAITGAEGLQRAAATSHANNNDLVSKLSSIVGVEQVFSRPGFHEAVLKLDYPVKEVTRALTVQNIIPGYDLSEHYPELGNALLVCTTETKTPDDINKYAENLNRVLNKRNPVKCPIQPKW